MYPSKIRKSRNITHLKCLAAFNIFSEISQKKYKASIYKCKFTYICKHFFTVIDRSKSNFSNISKLFLEHPYIKLDSALFERKTNETTTVSNTETKYGNHKEENSPKLLENDCPVEDANTHMDFQLPLRQTELKTARINFRATLKELYDLSCLMKGTENVKNYTKTINLMVREIKQNIKVSKILLERNSWFG